MTDRIRNAVKNDGKYAALLAAVDAVLRDYHRGILAETQHEMMHLLSEAREKVKEA